jgi:hypothetical protein
MKKWGSFDSLEYRIFPYDFFYIFYYLPGLDVYLLQIQTCCCKINLITDFTAHTIRYYSYFSLYFATYLPHQKNMLETKVADVN